MNDNEIRLEILFDYYKAMRNHSRIPDQKDNPKLKEIDRNNYQFNFGYLVKHELVKGTIHYSTDGTEDAVPTGGITAYGLDIIERFIDGCIETTKKTKNTIISNSLTYIEKIAELILIWSNHSDLFQQALDLLSNLIR